MHAGIPPPSGKETPRQDRHHLPSPSKPDPPVKIDPPDKADTPLARQTPPWQDRPPSAQCMLGDTVNKRAVCILLECNSCDLLGVNCCANYFLNNGLYSTKRMHSHLLFGQILRELKGSIMDYVPIFAINHRCE